VEVGLAVGREVGATVVAGVLVAAEGFAGHTKRSLDCDFDFDREQHSMKAQTALTLVVAVERRSVDNKLRACLTLSEDFDSGYQLWQRQPRQRRATNEIVEVALVYMIRSSRSEKHLMATDVRGCDIRLFSSRRSVVC